MYNCNYLFSTLLYVLKFYNSVIRPSMLGGRQENRAENECWRDENF